MKILKSILINCQKSTLLSTKAMEEPLRLSEKLQQQIHFLLCKPCKYFSDQVHMIHDRLKSLQRHSGVNFSSEKKQDLQEKVNRAC